MKNKLMYIIIYMSIGILITVISLTFMDNYIYSINNSSILIENVSSSNDVSMISNNENIKLEDDFEFVQYSYNNKYYLYLKDDKIYINDIETKEIVNIIEEENPICFYNLLYDKNLIIYFTEKKSGNYSKLTLKTYEISSENKMSYNSFNIYNFLRIKELEGSPIINVKYINVESEGWSGKKNTVYRIDLFNSMTTAVSGKIISKLTMLKQKDSLYYENDNGDIYYSWYKLSIFEEKVSLIGTDLDDNVYFISTNNKDKVYKVKNNKIIETIELTDTDIKCWYSDNTNVYLIYPTYIINISSEDKYKRLIKLSNYVTFEAIKGNTVYLRAQDNIIITRELLEK